MADNRTAIVDGSLPVPRFVEVIRRKAAQAIYAYWNLSH